MANVYKRYLTLQDQSPVRLKDVTEYNYDGTDFTTKTLLKFNTYWGSTILTQGDKVISLRLTPKFSIIQWVRNKLKRGQ